ncbi:MAG TPA: signal peptidase I, partial [Candidatus Saccharimonadales bacterium]|nr:signal peptidase I [Candidatus Saccharimonadales bacterium]
MDPNQPNQIPPVPQPVQPKPAQHIPVWIILVLIFIGIPFILSILASIFIVIYIFFFRPFQISGNAMNPSYVNDQYYMTGLVTRNLVTRGDVIVFQSLTNPDSYSIKRIIGVPGDQIMLQQGSVYINSKKLNEPYVSPQAKTIGGTFLLEGKTVTVPQNEYFVLADNRPNSTDSREWGFLPKKNILGKVLFCYWNCQLKPSPIIAPTITPTPPPTPDPTANWKTYTNTKYSFTFKYPPGLSIVLPSLEDYKLAPDRADMIVPEKTRDISLMNDSKTLLHIGLFLNTYSSIEEIKKNPIQGGSAPVIDITDIMIDNKPGIRFKLNCSGLKGCFEGPDIETVHNNVEYSFILFDERVSDQILSTFKFIDPKLDSKVWVDVHQLVTAIN